MTAAGDRIAVRLSTLNALRAAVMSFEAVRNHERTCQRCLPGNRCDTHGRLWNLALAANTAAIKAISVQQ